MKKLIFRPCAQTWVPEDERSPQASLCNQERWGDQKEFGKKYLPVGGKMGSANPRESIFGRKIRLGGSANRAGPTIGQFLKGGPRFDSVFRVPHSRVIHIPANVTGVLFHIFLSFLVFFSSLPGRREKSGMAKLFSPLKSGYSLQLLSRPK
jgi:hypothetical protein